MEDVWIRLENSSKGSSFGQLNMCAHCHVRGWLLLTTMLPSRFWWHFSNASMCRNNERQWRLNLVPVTYGKSFPLHPKRLWESLFQQISPLWIFLEVAHPCTSTFYSAFCVWGGVSGCTGMHPHFISHYNPIDRGLPSHPYHVKIQTQCPCDSPCVHSINHVVPTRCKFSHLQFFEHYGVNCATKDCIAHFFPSGTQLSSPNNT